MYDVLLRGGSVVDGTGSPRYTADVGIRDGKIVAIGDTDESARQVIDVTGLVVAPGCVDVHTHFDVQGFWDPYLTPAPFHGTTTVFAGNCGFTVAPLNPGSADYLMRMLARVEGMPLASLEQGVPWDWTSSAEYFDRLDGTLALNTGLFVGHSAMRYEAMGPAAIERAATDDEIATMRHLLRDGLDAGGFGFSTSRSATHNDATGRPVPSRFAAMEEFVTLATECGAHPGTSLEILPGIAPFTDEEVERMVLMSVAAGRPVNWNPLEVSARTMDVVQGALGASDVAAKRGGRIVALTLPVSFVLHYSFLTGVVLDALPEWGEIMAQPAAEKLRAFRDPATREQLRRAADQPSRMRSVADWDRYAIAQTTSEKLKHYEGRAVSDIARERGVSEFDALVDIVCEDELHATFGPIGEPSAEDWAARLQVWRDPRAVIGASDAGAHLDFVATFDLATRMLQQAVREQQLLPLEEAIHLLTQRPAQLYGLVDRGTVTEGSIADLMVFDEDTIGSGPVAMRFDLPGGAGRLYGEGVGIEMVFVNGEMVVQRGELTGAVPGVFLRSGRDSTSPPV